MRSATQLRASGGKDRPNRHVGEQLDRQRPGPRGKREASFRSRRSRACPPRLRSLRPARARSEFDVPSSSKRPVRQARPGLGLAQEPGVGVELERDDSRARPALEDQPQAIVEHQCAAGCNRRAARSPRSSPRGSVPSDCHRDRARSRCRPRANSMTAREQRARRRRTARSAAESRAAAAVLSRLDWARTTRP